MRVTVIGLGPGAGADLTGRAIEALERCDLIVGYTAYIALLEGQFPDKERRSTGMRREVDRCRMAVEAAAAAVAGAFTNTILVMGTIGLVFRQAYATAYDLPVNEVIGVIMGVVAVNGVPEAVAAAVLVPAVALPLQKALKRDTM